MNMSLWHVSFGGNERVQLEDITQVILTFNDVPNIGAHMRGRPELGKLSLSAAVGRTSR
jgi:hypothetical protein